MLPSQDQMMFCIMQNGEIVDGAHGLAIGSTEIEAWERALDPCGEWSIEKAKQSGSVVRCCAIMVINP
jgi:hypothetical protein